MLDIRPAGSIHTYAVYLWDVHVGDIELQGAGVFRFTLTSLDYASHFNMSSMSHGFETYLQALDFVRARYTGFTGPLRTLLRRHVPAWCYEPEAVLALTCDQGALKVRLARSTEWWYFKHAITKTTNPRLCYAVWEDGEIVYRSATLGEAVTYLRAPAVVYDPVEDLEAARLMPSDTLREIEKRQDALIRVLRHLIAETA